MVRPVCRARTRSPTSSSSGTPFPTSTATRPPSSSRSTTSTCKLTGRTCASFDSIAAHWVTDNRVIDRVVYDRRLLESTGLERAKLPDLVPPGTDRRRASPTEAASDLGHAGRPAGGRPVRATCTRRCSARARWPTSTPTSTSGPPRGSRVTCPFKKTAPTSNVASIPAALAGKYVIADEHETAGACLTFLRDNLGLRRGLRGDGRDGRRGRRRAAAGCCSRPWLNGERSPVDDHTIRGGFHNLSLVDDHGPDGPGRLRGGGLQLAVAARRGREVRRSAVRLAGLHRGRGQLRPVVPRSTPT